MAEGLIIVESPAKARTLKRFLGDRFDVRASMGHVRDLPERELAVDVEHDFRPSYRVVGDRQETINALKKAVKNQAAVILASDPDREGEAIAWHLAEVLRLRDPRRIEFHEINPQTSDIGLSVLVTLIRREWLMDTARVQPRASQAHLPAMLAPVRAAPVHHSD